MTTKHSRTQQEATGTNRKQPEVTENDRKGRKRQTRQPDNPQPKYKPPVNIPLDFETAVEGLLQVDPKSPEREDDGAEEKPDEE